MGVLCVRSTQLIYQNGMRVTVSAIFPPTSELRTYQKYSIFIMMHHSSMYCAEYAKCSRVSESQGFRIKTDMTLTLKIIPYGTEIVVLKRNFEDGRYRDRRMDVINRVTVFRIFSFEALTLPNQPLT